MLKDTIKFLIGEKIGMTQIFKNNEVIPVTVIKAGPCVVTDIKLPEKNGYLAVQIGYKEKKKIKKPVEGQLKDLGKFSIIKEFRLPEPVDLQRGDVLKVDIFKAGDLVNISGKSKAKGFQGVVKRHGFKDGPKSHGQKNKFRHPGAIGGRYPQRVIKGLRMAGRTGGERITLKNLEVVEVIPEDNLLIVKGSVVGKRGEILEIRSSTLSNHGSYILLPQVKKHLQKIYNLN